MAGASEVRSAVGTANAVDSAPRGPAATTAAAIRGARVRTSALGGSVGCGPIVANPALAEARAAVAARTARSM